MTIPATCHCGILVNVPHEHAQGAAQTGAALLPLSSFGSTPAEAEEAAGNLVVRGLLAKVGEGLYKPTAHGLKTFFTNNAFYPVKAAETPRAMQVPQDVNPEEGAMIIMSDNDKKPAAEPSKWCWCGILMMVPHEHAGFVKPAQKCWCGVLMATPHEHAGYPPGKGG